MGGAELSIGLSVLKLHYSGEEKILLILHGKIVKIIFPRSGGNEPMGDIVNFHGGRHPHCKYA